MENYQFIALLLLAIVNLYLLLRPDRRAESVKAMQIEWIEDLLGSDLFCVQSIEDHRKEQIDTVTRVWEMIGSLDSEGLAKELEDINETADKQIVELEQMREDYERQLAELKNG